MEFQVLLQQINELENARREEELKLIEQKTRHEKCCQEVASRLF